MNADFKKAVENKDIINVRFFLTNELGIDPRGGSFHEMLAYAESKLDNLYVADNGKKIEQDPNTWDDTYLSKVKTEAERNFSREKLAYYEKVAKQVLKDKAKRKDHWFEKNKKKIVCSGITVGGAVLTTVGLCVSKDDDIATLTKVAITSLGIAGLVVGGYMLYKELKNNN